MQKIRKRACGLVRVSTEEQARGGFGLKFQEEDIRKFCERNDLELLQVFRDEGYSGSTSDRPGFKEMMAWAREKRFDTLVVWKLDRLFRDTKLTLQTVDELATLDIEFRSVQEAFTHDSNGRFLLTIFAAGAEKERKDIAMRMYAGRTVAAKNGTLISGASLPAYGYRYNQTTKRLEVDEEEAAVVQNIFHWLVDERLSLYKIQSRLNDLQIPTKFDRIQRKKPTGTTGWWNKRTIGRIVANATYTGQITFRKYRSLSRVRTQANLRPEEDWISVATPQIITKQVFEQAQEQLKRNAENSTRRTNKLYLLSKLLICGHDGRRMQAASRPRNSATHECKYYFCSGVRKTHAAVRCPSRSLSESRLAPPVWEKLKELLSRPEPVLQQLAQYQREKTLVSEAKKKTQELEQKTKHIEERIRRLIQVYVSEAVDKSFFDKEYRRLREHADELGREIRKIESLAVSAERIIASKGTIEALYERYKDKLENASNEQKRGIFLTLIKSIVVRGDDLEIEVRLPHVANFAGQPLQRLSRKEPPPLFLKAKLLPVSQVFSKLGMHKNLGKFARKWQAAHRLSNHRSRR